MRPDTDGFASHASALLFAYFAAVLTVTMLVLHPAYLALSAVFAGAYLASMGGLRTLGKTLCWMLPVMLIAVGFNVAFNHRGMTALFYLKNGNAVTMESLVFGLCAAAMLLALISMNLGVMNLLPLAITDGGVLCFLLLQGIRGKPLSRKVQERIQTGAMYFFLAFFLYVTFQDILRFKLFLD